MSNSMFVASLDAIAGSVMRNADLIFPSRSGVSHVFRCASLPNLVRTSMLPVSGAEQFMTSLAIWLRPSCSAIRPYSRLLKALLSA